jgi:hypothetical protein
MVTPAVLTTEKPPHNVPGIKRILFFTEHFSPRNSVSHSNKEQIALLRVFVNLWGLP